VIRGIGVDVVDVARFGRAIARTPRLVPRLFAESELARDDGRALGAGSLAGRFAAKEALIKAVGGSARIGWREMRVRADPEGDPGFEFDEPAARILADRGIGAVHLSISHDAGVAVAYVVAERDPGAA